MVSSDTSVESEAQMLDDDLPANPRSLINRELKADIRDKQSLSSDGVDGT